jgi:hypothetical protein
MHPVARTTRAVKIKPSFANNCTRYLLRSYYNPDMFRLIQWLSSRDLSKKTKNTIQNYLQTKKHNTDKYNRSGIDQIKCNSCQLKYTGQTGKNFRTRYKEHIQVIHSNKMTSRYAQHILDTQHAYATMKYTLDILHIERKGPLMNTLERFHIYKLSKENMHVKDTYGDMFNLIFNLITKYY